MIEFSCPSCGRAMLAPESAVGVAGQCPSCGTTVKVPLPVWTLKTEPVSVAPQVAADIASDEIPLLEAEEEPFPFLEPVISDSYAASYRRKAAQSPLVRVTVKLLAVVLSAYLIAKFLPWTMLLVSLGVCVAGVAFLVIPPVRMRVQERLPKWGTHPKSRFVTGRAVAYCALVFCLSIWVIRENWRIQAHDEHVARLIHDAELSLGFGRIDDADDITRGLETDREVSDPMQVKGLRSQVDAALNSRNVKRANERVFQIVNAAHEHLLARRFGEVEKALIEAFGQKLASDLEPAKKMAIALVAAKVTTATEAFDNRRFDEAERALREIFATRGITAPREAKQLADRILDIKVSSARKLIEAKDLDGARKLAAEGETLPGITEKHGLKELFIQIANADVAASAAIANGHIQAEKFDSAEQVLKAALSTKNATEFTEIHALIAKIASERERVANARVASLVADAKGLPPKDARKVLSDAIATPYATDLHDAQQQLSDAQERYQLQVKQKRQEEAKALAKEEAKLAKADAAVRKVIEESKARRNDSATGGKVTVAGYLAAVSEADLVRYLNKAEQYIDDGDDAALAKLKASGIVFPLSNGIPVEIIETKTGRVKFRLRGKTFWTTTDAIR